MSIIKKIFENLFQKKSKNEKKFSLENDIEYEIQIESIYSFSYQGEEMISTEMPLFDGAPSQYIKLKNEFETALYTNAKGTIQGLLKDIVIEDKIKTSSYSFESLGEKVAKTEIKIIEVEQEAISKQIDIEPVITITKFLENGNAFGAFVGVLKR